MWKRAFLGLLSINLLIVAAIGLWLDLLPPQSAPPPGRPVPAGAAAVQVAVGDDAINAYLEYALAQQPDMRKVLSYARVHFASNWDVSLGVKLADRVVPFDLTFSPRIAGGDLVLQVQGAEMGHVPIPTSLLMVIFRHLPWPDWIRVDDPGSQLVLRFSARPQRPYGVRMVSYSAADKRLTANIYILPKSIASMAHSAR
ncbi:hypothetical protein GCM10010885_13460 [Alicyclobacillus cellulosilyticus]|uniref:DUF2140 family protein n=1 Tax=Alicyclobacillus cellulosilyticus TaxID=1003997 RepID=A0A917KCN4_9BACL|nr:DUF2140 family protein [Alicyclobacillus cellulosilyticus]GGJ05625.1 hypothetical protein GCM10010885_13460 [Alicyclobacillus cellulosilyticus]